VPPLCVTKKKTFFFCLLAFVLLNQRIFFLEKNKIETMYSSVHGMKHLLLFTIIIFILMKSNEGQTTRKIFRPSNIELSK